MSAPAKKVPYLDDCEITGGELMAALPALKIPIREGARLVDQTELERVKVKLPWELWRLGRFMSYALRHGLERLGLAHATNKERFV